MFSTCLRCGIIHCQMTDLFKLPNPISEITNTSPVSDVPWTIRDIFGALLSVVLILVIAILLGQIWPQSMINIDPGVIVTLGTLALLIPIWYYTTFKYKTSWTTLGLRPFPISLIGFGIVLLMIFYLLNGVYAALLNGFGLRIQPEITPLFESSPYPIILILGGTLVAPIVEELLFRGFIFTGLYHRLGWKRAMIISSALFAIVHITPTSFLPIFILGSLFAYLYHVSGSILPGILLHTFINGLAFAATYMIYTQGLQL